MRTIRFFTLPPTLVEWPFILINLNRPDDGFRYLRHHKRSIRAILIDSGIEVFRDPMRKEYPRGAKGQIHYAVRVYEKAKYMFPGVEIWITIPDYPDDYHPGNLWISKEITNIERTLQNVLYAVDNFPEINWLIPVQGWNKKPKSIVRSIQYYDEYGILRKYHYYAIANLCVEGSINIIIETLKIARSFLWSKKLHSFGLNMKAIVKAYYYKPLPPLLLYTEERERNLVDSFDKSLFNKRQPYYQWFYSTLKSTGILDTTDSTAWTKPCKEADEKYLKPQGRKRASRKNNYDSIVYFWAWVYTLTHKYGVELEGVSKERIEEECMRWLSWALEREREARYQTYYAR